MNGGNKIRITILTVPKRIEYLGEMVARIEKVNPNVQVEISLLIK